MSLHLAEIDDNNKEPSPAPSTYAAALQRQRSKMQMRDVMREKLRIHEPPMSDEVAVEGAEHTPMIFTEAASGDPNANAVDLGAGIECCPFTGKQLY